MNTTKRLARRILMSNGFIIDLRISRVKCGQGKIISPCPFCNKINHSWQAMRIHLTRHHKNELGYKEIKRQASKLWRLYQEVKT